MARIYYKGLNREAAMAWSRVTWSWSFIETKFASADASLGNLPRPATRISGPGWLTNTLLKASSPPPTRPWGT